MFNARCFFAFTKTAENNQAAISCKLFSTINLISSRGGQLDPVQISFGFVFGIVELLRTSVFASLFVSGSADELSLEASVYVFSFSFSEESSVEMSQSGSLADLEVNVVGDKSVSAIFVSRFPISRAGIKRESSFI